MAAVSMSNIPECSICCENFKIPKILPCGHTFCLDCIDRYIDDRTEAFPCPVCGQDVKIPEGGAKIFTTNFMIFTTATSEKLQATMTSSDTAQETSTTSPDTAQDSSTTSLNAAQVLEQSSSPVKHYCSNHAEREVEYYCINCNILLCCKCFIKQHNGHEYYDVECDTAKEKATESVLNSQKFIQNKIDNLEKTHAALIETSECLKSFGEDACSRITKQTDKIIADLIKSSEKVKTDIRKNVDQTDTELVETREKVMEQIKNFKLDLETNLSSSLSEDSCVQILVSLSKIKHLEQLCESMKDHSSEVYKYMDWREKNFSVDIDMLGSVVSKSYYIPVHKVFIFRFNVDDIKDVDVDYYSKDKFISHGIVWSCFVTKYSNVYLGIWTSILSSDNPKLSSCIMDGQFNLLNTDDESATIIKNHSDIKIKTDQRRGYKDYIRWHTFIDKNKGYFSSTGQFVVQIDMTKIRDKTFK